MFRSDWGYKKKDQNIPDPNICWTQKIFGPQVFVNKKSFWANFFNLNFFGPHFFFAFKIYKSYWI